MSEPTVHIATWLAAGLIDEATADRLRAAGGMPDQVQAPVADAEITPPADRPKQSPMAALFGPGATVGEMFGYLGLGFLLGAFDAFVVRLAGNGGDTSLAFAIWMAVGAAGLAVLGIVLSHGDERRGRAAGVAFLLSVGHAAAAGAAVAAFAHLEWPVIGVVSAAVASLVAIGARLVHPALLTQLGLVASVTGLAGILLSWLESVVVPNRFNDLGEEILSGRPNPLLLLIVSAAWWLVVALGIGLIGLREARTGTVAASRRAALTRLWASLVAVIGFTTAVTRSDFTAEGGGRVLEPWVGELAILILAAVLVERAFRRDATTFVVGAALAMIAALTDFNFRYLSSSTDVGLLIEGLILLGAGFAADRVRRLVVRGDAPPEQPSATPA